MKLQQLADGLPGGGHVPGFHLCASEIDPRAGEGGIVREDLLPQSNRFVPAAVAGAVDRQVRPGGGI